MIITCEKCKAVYCIAEKIIGPFSKRVKCTRCNHVWIVNVNAAQQIEQPSCYRKIFSKLMPLFLLINILLINFLFFPELFISITPFKEIYQKCGIYNSADLVLEGFNFEKQNETILVNGFIKNAGDEDRFLPNIRYILLDQNKKTIFKYTYLPSKKILRSGEIWPIDSKIINVNFDAEYLQLDIGNKLEFLLK